MFDFNNKFISIGTEYKKNIFTNVENNKLFSDNNLPPTKPKKGGMWASTLDFDGNYLSKWHKFILTKLDPELFKEKLQGKSTIFKINKEAKVLTISKLEDMVFIVENNELKSNIPIRYAKVIGNVPKECSKRSFIDFETLSNLYDAIYVKQGVLDYLQKMLSDFDLRITYGRSGFDENITPEIVFKAQLFEDWHVESLLVLNKECIDLVCSDTISNLYLKFKK